MTASSGLAALEEDLARQKKLLGLPPKAWMRPLTGPEGAELLDVAIVGAGLCGLVASAALSHLGVTGVRLFDRAPEGLEGPWITYARMETLRTAKEATGPALGIPALTFRAWFEAQWGEDAWDRMDFAPRAMWMDYMNWYRKVTDPDIVNGCDVTAIVPEGRFLRLTTSHGAFLARRVVIASGLDALGAPRRPEVANKLPKGKILHAADVFDVDMLRGKRVVGAGASAMDNAAAALEAGAARVDVLVRRPDLPAIDKFTGTGSKGMTHGYIGLPDDAKWALMDEGDRFPVPPPKHSVERVAAYPNAFLHLASPVTGLAETADGVRVETPNAVIETNAVILATGFGLDLALRPELAHFAAHIRTWGDVVGPEKAAANPALAGHPYLADDFAFTEKTPGACPALSKLFCFAYAAVPTHGKVTSGIPAASDGADRLAKGLVRSFFAEDADFHLARFCDYSIRDFDAGTWEATAMEIMA